MTLSATCAWLAFAARRIHRLRKQIRAVQYDASHDQLTGLPNRAHALDRLTRGEVAMLGVLDLDGFKTVNDRYGHRAGDELLAAIASRLAAALGREGFPARLSGDEFLLIWPRRPDRPTRAAANILAHLSRPLIIDGHHLHPAGSLGLAVAGPHLHGIGLLSAADHAMYTAKTDHRGGVHLYPGSHPPPPTDRRAHGRTTPPPVPEPHGPGPWKDRPR